MGGDARLCKRVLYFLGGTAFVGLFLTMVFVLNAGRFLAQTSLPQKADAIIVLGGEHSNFPRTKHALDLYYQGYAPQVVFSGGRLKDVGLACSSTELSVEAAVRLGLPPDAVVIAPEAQSTYDEARNVSLLIRQKDWHSIILVTNVFHARRALHTFRSRLPDVVLWVSAPADPRYDPDHWWRTEDGLVSVVTEWLKLGFYWVKYGISPL